MTNSDIRAHSVKAAMESLPKDCILEFNPDTLTFLRKQYNLDKPGRIEEAISVLQEWINKQPHFLKKDFRKYLFSFFFLYYKRRFRVKNRAS